MYMELFREHFKDETKCLKELRDLPLSPQGGIEREKWLVKRIQKKVSQSKYRLVLHLEKKNCSHF